MEDGAFKPNTTMLGSLSDNTMDFSLMDELLLDGFWLETTTDESNFWQPGPSSNLDNHSLHSHTPEINFGHSNSDLNQVSISAEGKYSDLIESRSSIHFQMDQVGARQSQDQEAILQSTSPTQSQGLVVEGTEMNRRLWVGPNRNVTSNALVRNRLVQAIEYLKESTREKDVLIQLWVPIQRAGKNVLTTKNQPFSLNPNYKSLARYRNVSKTYQFAIEEDSKGLVGLPGRVFLKKLPEWTPDVRFFRREEYPRINHAHQYNIGGTIALPVFERGSGTCLGVIEIISTSQIASYRLDLENVCKALEAVDLKSSNILVPPEVKDYSEIYQFALAEIKDVLKCVCDMHKLPLAQTWAPCSQQGKGGCRHSDENYAYCVSTIDYACYVRDPLVWDFHVACSEHHLLKGEGVAGGAFTTNQPCFATDITAFSKTEYPLSHHAKMFHLCAAVAIRLWCIYSGSADFVLEFFLPLDCRDAEDQKEMLNSLSSGIQQICRSFRVVTDEELKEETASPTAKRTISLVNKSEKEESLAQMSPSKKSSQDVSSWIAMASMVDEGKGKGKGIAFSLDNHKKEPEEEFKLTNYWDNNTADLHHVPTDSELNQIQQNSELKESASGSCDYSIIGKHHYSGSRRAGERRRTKTEKTISLQELRQYFAGSLKDAAKSIGVCPTTLKRICRQHGITRWPSRKIKKVGHSLRKLQLVIDSVQGAEGSIQLSSFYNNFPELGSTNSASPRQFPTSNPSDNPQKLNLQLENLSPATTASKSPSSSGSHNSSSSFSCSIVATQSAFPVNPSTEHCIRTLKRACSDAELQNMVQEETRLLVRSRSHKTFTEDASPEALPPLPKASSQIVQNRSTYRVKATFGEEKVRFSIRPNSGFADLLQEVKRRFSIDDATRIDLKYLDDDFEWVLLTCDADLEECIDVHKSSRSRTIKLSLHQPYHPILPNSFGSRGPS